MAKQTAELRALNLGITDYHERFRGWNRAMIGAYLKGYASTPGERCPYRDIRKPAGQLTWSRAYIRSWEDGEADKNRRKQK